MPLLWCLGHGERGRREDHGQKSGREQPEAAAPYIWLLRSCCGDTGDGAVGGTGNTSIFMQGPAPSSVQELLFACHTHIPKQSHLAERDGGKTKPPELGDSEW